MAYSKCHNPITFVNGTSPALNATNLNYEDGCLDTVDTRVCQLDANKVSRNEVEDVLERAEAAAESAEADAQSASDSADRAFHTTPEGYEALVNTVGGHTTSITNLNNNLSAVKFNGNAGGKNLFDSRQHFSKTDVYAYCYIPSNQQRTLSISVKGILSELEGISFGWCNDVNNITSGSYDWLVNNGNLSRYSATSQSRQYIFIYPITESVVQRVLDNLNIQLEYGNEATSFEPYIPSLLNLSDTKSHIGRLGNAIGMRGWNQLVQNGNFTDTSVWTSLPHVQTLSVSNNIGTVTCTNENNNWNIQFGQLIPIIVGHKYLLSCSIRSSYATSWRIRNPIISSQIAIPADVWTLIEEIIVVTSASDAVSIQLQHLPLNGTFDAKNFNMFDLTALFGAGNEPSSVEDFRAMFPADYYPYCSGGWADLLWENASPSSAFATQVISIDFSNYDFALIEYRPYASEDYSMFAIAIIKPAGYGIGGYLNFIASSTLGKRTFSLNKVQIDFAYGAYGNHGSSSLTTDNTKCVPIRVYGLK